MSTTFTTLKIIASEMKSINEDVFDDYSDSQLELLYQTVSKSDMKNDIIEALGLDVSDADIDTDIDSITDKYVVRLQKALMYKQCFYYYFNNNTGEGTKNNDRMNYFDNLYIVQQKKFNQLVIDTIEAGIIIPTGRM